MSSMTPLKRLGRYAEARDLEVVASADGSQREPDSTVALRSKLTGDWLISARSLDGIEIAAYKLILKLQALGVDVYGD